MEKIRKAIQEINRNKTVDAGNVNNNLYKEDVTLSNPVDIDYEFTRIIKLDQDHLKRNRIVANNKSDPLSLHFDILRTQVISKMNENGWKSIAVTSPTNDCGKSVVAINLAMSIAHHVDKTSLLADFDLRNPSIGKYLGLPQGPSLSCILSGECSVSDSLINPGLQGFVVLPTFAPVKKSSELLSSNYAGDFINELCKRYDERVTIFDVPPILGSDDAMIMMSQVDCVLLVVGNGLVNKSQLKESLRYIDQDKMLGTVLNKVIGMKS